MRLWSTLDSVDSALQRKPGFQAYAKTDTVEAPLTHVNQERLTLDMPIPRPFIKFSEGPGARLGNHWQFAPVPRQSLAQRDSRRSRAVREGASGYCGLREETRGKQLANVLGVYLSIDFEARWGTRVCVATPGVGWRNRPRNTNKLQFLASSMAPRAMNVIDGIPENK